MLKSLPSTHTAGAAQRIALRDLEAAWQQEAYGLDWRCLFTLPPWLNAWWSVFGHTGQDHIVQVSDPRGWIGLAPLRIDGSQATFIGSPDLCDYSDLVVVPERRGDFPEPFFNHLSDRGVAHLALRGVREDSVIWTDLIPYAQRRGWKVVREREDAAFEIALPPTWADYLDQLKGKQRHELRRKLRRLREAGAVRFRLLETAADIAPMFSDFISLFKASRKDKAAFMTESRARFFRTLVMAFTRQGIVKLGVLDLSGKPVSMVICFDHRSTRYLYNSGYDPHLRPLSVGLMVKILSVRDAVERNLARYDFLKGDEAYKLRLGAVPRDLFAVVISLPNRGNDPT